MPNVPFDISSCFSHDIFVNDDWERLAEILIQRRTAMGYRKRMPFARANGMNNDRILFDLENAKRTNYDRSTLSLVEQVYKFQPGSIKSVLAGGDPVEMTDLESDFSKKVYDHLTDDTILLDLPESALSGLGPSEREEVVAAAKQRALEIARKIRRELDGDK